MKMTILESNKSRRHARTGTIVDVAARSQQKLEALGVSFLGGNVNRRNAVVVALVDVAARIQQQLEALDAAFIGSWQTAPMCRYR